MSNQAESIENKGNSTPNNPSVEIVEIDLGKLSETQKLTLASVLGSFILQLIYLLNLGFVTDLFKNFIPSAYKDLTNYVRDFLMTFVVYFVVLFFVVALYIGYQILLNDKSNLYLGAQIFDYTVITALSFFALFFISIVIINPTPSIINETFPNLVELFLFLLMLALMVVIAMIPFYVETTLTKRENKPVQSVPQSLSNQS